MSFAKQISISFYKFLIISVFIGIFLFSNIALASTTNGAIDSTYKYAWGKNIGWINFGASNGNVSITDSALTGYAWSDNYGWINLNPTTSGVTNNAEGTLSGYAWGENLGWINFSGVTINSSGEFAGSASSTISDQISFDCANCSVKTDWRPASSRTTTATTGGGSLSREAQNPPTSVGIIVNDSAEHTASRIVALRLQAGANTEMMAISNSPDFFNISQEPYIPVKSWDLCSQRSVSVECPVENTAYTVYVKFYTKQWGRPSEIISDSIIYTKKETPKKSIVERLPEILRPLIPEFLKPKPPKIKPPEIPLEEILPKEAPLSLRRRWLLLDPKAIGRLVFAPLPKDFRVLAQKLPQLEETFNEVGITRMTELLKLKTAELTLPGLTEIAGLPAVKVEPGKFALPRGVPVANLSAQVKEKLPTEIIFAKTGGGLIDLNATLTLTDKGKAQQKIVTVSGKYLELVIKPDKPVKKIKGYVVFKSKKPRLSSFQIPLKSLTASLLFARPAFAFTPTPKTFIPVNGAESTYFNLISKDDLQSENFGVGARNRTQPVEVEEKLVLIEFEYTDPDGDGIYTAQIQVPVVDGEYEIITVMDYEDPALGMKEVKLITVIDPEGYIYEKIGAKETRIPGAIVSLQWLNPETKQYESWPAKEYQQENPQITDIRGTYSFLVPEGFYYLKVETPGYPVYDGKPFQVTEGSGIHINIELKTKYWWLKAVDYKTIILLLVIVLLCYNFYRDRVRDRLSRKVS